MLNTAFNETRIYAGLIFKFWLPSFVKAIVTAYS
jgi:hypothetical protein